MRIKELEEILSPLPKAQLNEPERLLL